MVTPNGTQQTHIEVRYEEHHTAPGGSIWVRVQNRPYNYNDEWQCVWSTDPGSRELRLSMADPRFDAATSPAVAIAIPVSWLADPAAALIAALPAAPPPPQIEAPQ